MSGHVRLSCCAALATLAAASALLPLVNPAYWFLQAAGLVAAQAAVGTLARRVPLAPPLVVGLQVLVPLLLLTLLFTRQEAVGGVLPGADAFQEFGRLLGQGAQDVGRFAPPAPMTDGIRLMLVGGVLVIGLLVDVLAVTFRSAAPAGLPLLALYSVAAGLGQDGARWLWFLCAAAGYLLLLLAEGRERVFRWGHVFTDPGRPGNRPHPPDGGDGADSGPGTGAGGATPGRRARTRIRTGHRIGVLTLGIALAVPAALPSLGGGLLDPQGADGDRAQDHGGTISAVNPLVALQDSLNQPENRTALTYTTDAQRTEEMYFRIVALDRFDGSAWKPSERRIDSVPDQLPAPAGLSPGVRTQKVRSSVTAARWYAQNWLPMPYPASKVRIGGRWRFEPEGRTLVGDRGQTTRGVQYEVESLQVRPTARRLSRAPEPPPELQRQYTKVPRSLPPVVRETALRVTEGAQNDYERAVRLQDWFASDNRFQYDTQVRAGSGSAAIVNFLEQKEGFCVHFAFSMAAMARTLDIPARVAVGFTPGTKSADGRTAVGLKDAHAWPELYFEGVGWTRFEPTPTRGSTPDYARPTLPDPDEDAQGRLPESDEGSAPAEEPGKPGSCTAEEKRSDPECGAAPAPDKGGKGGGSPAGTVTAAAAVLLVLVLPLLPLMWRLRVRRRRLAPGYGQGAGPQPEEGGPEEAAVLAAWRELTDTAWDYGILPDDSATPRSAASRIARVGQLEPGAEAAAHRAARAVEQILYAPRPRTPADMTDDVRLVRHGLRRTAPPVLRARAVLLPRSAVRLLWGVTGYWTGLRARTVHWAGAVRMRFAK